MLTPEQQQLVTDNHSLIYGFMKSKGLEFDDYYDLCAIGLCNAAQTYSPEKSNFSTYAYKCMSTEVGHYYTIQNAKKRQGLEVSYSRMQALHGSKEIEVEKYTDSMSYEPDFTRPAAEEIFSALSPLQREVISLMYHKFNICEIADMFGISRQAVQQRREQAKKRLIRKGVLANV